MAYGAGPAGLSSSAGNISGYNVRQLPLYTADQQQLFNAILGGVSPGAKQGIDYLSRLAGGDESAFQAGEAPAYRSFQHGIDEIAKRYAAKGALGSSGFRQAASGAAGELGENLAARRQQLQMSAIERLLGLSSGLLSKPAEETLLEPKNPTYGDLFKGVLTKILGAF
jgi:hypothetical protein